MVCRKHILACFLILIIFAISGCGRKTAEEEAREPLEKKRESQWTREIPVIPKEKTAGPSDVRAEIRAPIGEAPKMIEPERGIISEEGEILVADFEGWPNCLGGEMGVYGSLEPNWEEAHIHPVSWVYESTTLGYNGANVHSGMQSFRLVNGLGTKRDLAWGSFSMDLGPTIDTTVTPKKVESLDVSEYKYLVFWVKGEKGGEKMELLLRDAHSLNYMPQVKYKLPDATTEWQKAVVPLAELKGKIDLAAMDNIGLAFGKDVGNIEGDIAYVDDFVFTNNQ